MDPSHSPAPGGVAIKRELIVLVLEATGLKLASNPAGSEARLKFDRLEKW